MESALRDVGQRAGRGASATGFSADHADLAQIALLARTLLGAVPRIEGLVLCAAVNNPAEPRTDGIDTTLVVNHLAPVLLTGLLAPALTGGRVVLVSSSRHGSAGQFDPSVFQTEASSTKRYEMTKLLNLLWAAGRLQHAHVGPMEVIDPGFVRTALGRRASGALRLVLALTRPMQTAPEVPAALIANRLDAPDFTDGAFRNARGLARRAANASDPAAIDHVWQWTEDLLERAGHRDPTRPHA